MTSESLVTRLKTVQLVPVTAFDARGELALPVMQQHTERLLEAGVRVLIPCAGSAEFHSLSLDEIVATVKMMRQVAGKEAVIMAPIGLRLQDALALGERTIEAGADCILVMPLDFPYLSDAGARDYYTALLERLNVPLLLYKKSEIPSDDLLLELAEHPRLIGVKYAVNDLPAFQQVVERDRGRIEWYCGSAERFAPYYALAGAPGYTSGAGNICPRVTLAMHAALAAGNWTEAFRLQRILLPIECYRARQGNSYNISLLKYAIRATGLDFGEPRPPQRRLTAAEQREIDALLTPILNAERELA